MIDVTSDDIERITENRQRIKTLHKKMGNKCFVNYSLIQKKRNIVARNDIATDSLKNCLNEKHTHKKTEGRNVKSKAF